MFSDGRNVHVARLTGTGVVVIDSAEVPGAGLLGGHVVFGVMKHPTQPWLYVSSFNECYAMGDWCWGNARIDRFTVSKTGVDHAGAAFVYDGTATLATCAADDWGYTGQVGSCAPVNGVFSPDGTRLYMKEDSNDVLDIFQVNANGSLTMLWEGASIDLHGMAMDPTGTYLYNGASVLTVAGDEGTNLTVGTGGNYTTYLVKEADDLLLSTSSTNAVSVYSLADPEAPAGVDSVTFASNGARAVAINAAGDRIVAAGRNNVATIGFDGAALTLEDSFDPSNGSTIVENRGVAMSGDGTHAAVAWFQENATSDGWIGGVTVYSIDPDGVLSTAGTLDLPGSARVVQTMVLP